jgi:hypothetical protein
MTTSAPPAGLPRQIRATVEEWRPATPLLAVHVILADSGHALTCQLWTGDLSGAWACRAELHDGVGATLEEVESAVVLAGYVYDFAGRFDGDRSAHWGHDSTTDTYTLDITRPW